MAESIAQCPVCEDAGKTKRVGAGFENSTPIWTYQCDSCDALFDVYFGELVLARKIVIEAKDYEAPGEIAKKHRKFRKPKV